MLIKLSLLLLGGQSHALGWGAQPVRSLWHEVAVVEDQWFLLPFILLLGVTVRMPSLPHIVNRSKYLRCPSHAIHTCLFSAMTLLKRLPGEHRRLLL